MVEKVAFPVETLTVWSGIAQEESTIQFRVLSTLPAGCRSVSVAHQSNDLYNLVDVDNETTIPLKDIDDLFVTQVNHTQIVFRVVQKSLLY